MEKLADFEPFVGQRLKVRLQSGQQTEMSLIEAKPLPEPEYPPEGVRKAPFLLIFSGPLDSFHQSGCLEIAFGENAPMALAMYPERQEGESVVYSAVFN